MLARPWIPPVVLSAIAAVGLAVRLLPFVAGGTLLYPIDYDEGVYFSAAALLTRGVLPYRDFAFVHPPGALLFLGPLAAWRADPAVLFAACRWVAAALGAVNVYLAGRVAWRWAGPIAGAAAAVLYALYPEAAAAERGPFLEPLLNTLCFALALVWLREPLSARRCFWAGVLGGAALAVKVWGGAWLLAAVVALPVELRRRSTLLFLAGVAAALLVLVGPFVALAPRDFLKQTLLFHAWRPPDGIGGAQRFFTLFNVGHRTASVLALLGLGVAVARVRRAEARHDRFFALTAVSTVVGLLASASYFTQYNAHLAAVEAVLGGFGLAIAWEWLSGRWRLARIALLAVVALGLWRTGRSLRSDAEGRMPEQVAFGELLRRQVPKDTCLLSLEPAWGVLAGRLPDVRPGLPVMVDSYATLLVSAMSGGARYAEKYPAFADGAAQGALRPWLADCRYLAAGTRGAWELSAESWQFLEFHYERLEGVPGARETDLWRRRERSPR